MPVISLTPAHQLVIDGETLPVHLTRTEVRVLTGIFESRQAYTVDHFERAYGAEEREAVQLLRTYIRKLRVKLGDHSACIKVVWGMSGYTHAPEYSFDPGQPGMTNVLIETTLLDKIALYDLTPPEALITKLLEKHLAAEKLRP